MMTDYEQIIDIKVLRREMDDYSEVINFFIE